MPPNRRPCLFAACLSWLPIAALLLHDGEVFERDLGEHMEIGLADGGYKSVKLKCGSDSMQVHLETEDDFSGVIYTRGSFHEKRPPCFLDPGYERGRRSFSIRFGLDKCKTLERDNVYSNVLVLQHDKELIMPGDAAFNLECDFRNPREVAVKANLNHKQAISRITLTNADPAGRPGRSVGPTAESQNASVVLTPGLITLQN